MNIAQKNALFVVSLLIAVLLALGASASYLVRDHVDTQIDQDLRRAQRFFVQARQSAFDQMLAAARGIGREPALVAALLADDRDTLRGVVADLYPRPGVDLLALYQGVDLDDALAEGRKPQFSSPHALSSLPLQAMVRQAADSGEVAYGNALIFDTLLSLVATPIESPLGGSLGILVTGTEFSQQWVDTISQLAHAEVALLANNVVLEGTIAGLGTALTGLHYSGPQHRPLRFIADGGDYIGHLYPIRAGDGETRVAQVLLARDLASYWVPYRTLGSRALLSSLLIVLLATLLGIRISRANLTRPIAALVDATRQIAAGEVGYTATLSRADELGELACSLNGMSADLSASQAELERNRQRFHDFAEISSDWLWETDGRGQFTYVSSSVSASLALEPQVFIGRSLDEIFPRDDVADITTRLCKGPENARGFKDVGCIVTVPDGGRHYLRLNGIPVVEGMQFLGYRGTTRDVTKAKRDEQQLILLANQDQLTGLANRRRFLIDLAHEVRRAESIKRTGVLMLIDLDHLKLVNDSAGHSLGDQIIIQVAGNLARLCRTEDLVARVSGDEFAVAFPDMTEAQARDKATQVLAAVDAVRAVHQGQTVNITASIGIVQFPQHGRDAADLMAKVDAAMFAAKAGGRGCAAFFDEQKMARERIGTQLAWKSMLIEALADDSLALVFQPIAAVVDGTVHHHETLVRMRDERGVLVSPDNFIPLAEQFGLIGRIDRAVIRKALRHLAALPERYRDSGIAINLSGLSVGQSDVLHFIESELEDSGVAPARVTFEVTETAACENLNDAIEFISRIRQLGCKVSLDDFGVGFSSFSYLKHLKVDTLKIDGSFIRDIASNRDDQILVKALVDVARGLGIATIAEFVESEQAFEIIRRLGVDYVQGYFVGKPVPDLSVRRIELPASKAQAFDRQATGS